MIPVETFRGRQVALFGLGGSGMATAEALRAGGAATIVWDDSEAAITKARAAGLDARDLREIDWAGIAALILSPGVPLTHPAPHWSVTRAQAAGVEIIGDIELFCRERRRIAPASSFIAVTGTNGKSTTTALIAHLLGAAGREVAMGGNIGTPVLALAPPDPGRVHVIEVSSYQIDLAPALAPTIGILLNLTPDHLDRHGDMERYAAIKERLVQAADAAIIGVDDDHCEAIAVRLEHSGKPTIRISLAETLGAGIHVRGREIFAWRGHGRKLADLTGIAALRGDHNAQNAAAAIAACLRLGLTEAEIQAGLRTFPGLPHRLEQVGRIGRALAINDSKATNADSTEKALLAFAQGVFWILGGKPKAGGIESLRPLFGRVARAYLIGEAAPAFAETLRGAVPFEIAGTLEAAVAAAARDAMTSDFNEPVILLSPSCASFDQFPNFEVRGQRFCELAAAMPGFSAV
ncbi:UDP-N-acetylmuramoyl-L-alanine--D-glutamate ligase [Rhabdaerophilum calidifontis]|uniref:UDP-N-acetylmuramoyl-L-alanine--D-glutamate ligase n=1 Tax=Rhabdaerophilum calidifontis TaxID=2604328 RepID=UPI00123AA333|nr:UDP-N-acetylmuramoyl-L-alanine--D-glutamate ligase [Rhabdaerophilum calidifontis]